MSQVHATYQPIFVHEYPQRRTGGEKHIDPEVKLKPLHQQWLYMGYKQEELHSFGRGTTQCPMNVLTSSWYWHKHTKIAYLNVFLVSRKFDLQQHRCSCAYTWYTHILKNELYYTFYLKITCRNVIAKNCATKWLQVWIYDCLTDNFMSRIML